MILLWLILLLTALCYYLFSRQSKLRLPGPKGLPILGSALHIDLQRSHVTISKWAQQYGPVFAVNLFLDQMVFINDYETIHDVLVKRGDEFSDRPNLYRLKLYSRGWKGILNSSGTSTRWRALRKEAHKYIKVYGAGGVQRFEELIGDAINDQMERIACYQGEPFKVRQQFYNFGECIMYMLLYGERLEPNSDEAREIREMTEAFIRNFSPAGPGVLLDAFPWLNIFPNRTYNDIIKCNEWSDDFWKKQKIKLECNEQSDCFAKHLLTLKNDFYSDQGGTILDDTDVQIAISDLLGAGSTTTAATISTFILLMLHYPEVQLNLQQEVDAAVGSRKKVTLANRDVMPYTRAAIYELLRYASVAPLIPHAASQDTTINGEFIPKGTNVVVNLWNLHHDEAFWGDPWNYRPERYLDENGDLLPVDHPNRKRLIAFGAGPRVCLGESFALNRLFLFIASLIQKFEIRVDTAVTLLSCDPCTFVTGLVVHPEDFTVSMVPRDISSED